MLLIFCFLFSGKKKKTLVLFEFLLYQIGLVLFHLFLSVRLCAGLVDSSCSYFFFAFDFVLIFFWLVFGLSNLANYLSEKIKYM